MANRHLRAAMTAVLALALTATAESAVAVELTQGNGLPTAAPEMLTVTAPDEVIKGTRLYLTAKAETSLNAVGTIESSVDQTEWSPTGAKIAIVDGQGATSLLPSANRYYRITGAAVESEVWRTNVVSRSGYAISAGARVAQVHPLESAFIVGMAVKDGKPGAYRVSVEYQRSDSSWAHLQTVTAGSSGSFKVKTRPTGDRTYRAKIVSSSGATLATSQTAFVDYTSGTSTLEERRATLDWRLGAAKTGVRAISSTDVAAARYTGGASAARYQEFSKGMLVEVTSTSGVVNTWLLEGRHLTGYKDRSLWRGKLGLPERDAKSQLLEGGSVTLFSRGAVYTNKSSMSKGTYVAYGMTAQVETLAAAYSQKGYEEPEWRESKYNTWAGGDNAWCQVFVAWATHASGRPGEAPVRTYFPNYVSAVKASPALIRDPKASEIRAGDILLFDWGTGTPTHTGFAVRVSGGYVYTFEGNTTDGSGDPQRGVYARKRPLSGVWGMYHPGEYKATS